MILHGTAIGLPIRPGVVDWGSIDRHIIYGRSVWVMVPCLPGVANEVNRLDLDWEVFSVGPTVAVTAQRTRPNNPNWCSCLTSRFMGQHISFRDIAWCSYSSGLLSPASSSNHVATGGFQGGKPHQTVHSEGHGRS